MTREEILQDLSRGNVPLYTSLSKVDDECLLIIKENLDSFRAVNPESRLDGFATPGGKSLHINISVTINTLPYIVKPGK